MRDGAPVSDVAALLRELIIEQKQTNELIRRLLDRSHGPRLSPADRAALSELLPAVASRYGSGAFRAAEVCDLARLDPAELGRLLRRARGVDVDGLIVQRCGTEAGVALWQLTARGP